MGDVTIEQVKTWSLGEVQPMQVTTVGPGNYGPGMIKFWYFEIYLKIKFEILTLN